MSEPAVLTERDGHVLTITLNRPDKRNAFNAEVLCRLCDAWDLLDADPELRVGIMTGRRRQLLRRRRPRSPRRRAHLGQARRGRVRGADPPGLQPHLQGLPEGPLRAEADRRGGRGLLLRGRHGDPPGLRHPRRRRERAARHLRGAARPVPDVGQHDPAAAADPLHGRDGHAARRRPDHRRARLRGRPGQPPLPRRRGARRRPRRWPTASPPTARWPCATSRRR